MPTYDFTVGAPRVSGESGASMARSMRWSRRDEPKTLAYRWCLDANTRVAEGARTLATFILAPDGRLPGRR